jgi:hypothetical protein
VQVSDAVNDVGAHSRANPWPNRLHMRRNLLYNLSMNPKSTHEKQTEARRTGARGERAEVSGMNDERKSEAVEAAETVLRIARTETAVATTAPADAEREAYLAYVAELIGLEARYGRKRLPEAKVEALRWAFGSATALEEATTDLELQALWLEQKRSMVAFCGMLLQREELVLTEQLGVSQAEFAKLKAQIKLRIAERWTTLQPKKAK